MDDIIKWLMNVHQEASELGKAVQGGGQAPGFQFKSVFVPQENNEAIAAQRLELLDRVITAFEDAGKFREAEIMQRHFDRIASVL